MGRFDSESLYIIRRKAKAFLHSLAYYACRIFPIQPNKIVMWTFEGSGGYGCSPRYIAEELLKRNSDFEIVWLVEDMEKQFPPQIKKVKSTLWARAYHLSTARFWIANTRTFYGTRKRKGTTYIQTWHGSVSLKPIGKYRGNQFSKIAYIVSKADSDLADYALSGSRYCTDMWPDGLIIDKKKILTIGSPRCDVLINEVEKKHRQIRKEYGLPDDVKILIYAPTFRGGSQNTVRSVHATEATIDFDRLIAALEKRFGGTWYIFLRLHPQLTAQMKEMPISKQNTRLIDVSQRPDMNEIMAATDAIITDYSTAIFEGYLTGQPGFIYADDIDEYVADRGALMFSLDEIPFSVARNNDELVENVLGFDAEKYEKRRKAFITSVGSAEDGKARERVVELVEMREWYLEQIVLHDSLI